MHSSEAGLCLARPPRRILHRYMCWVSLPGNNLTKADTPVNVREGAWHPTVLSITCRSLHSWYALLLQLEQQLGMQHATTVTMRGFSRTRGCILSALRCCAQEWTVHQIHAKCIQEATGN